MEISINSVIYNAFGAILSFIVMVFLMKYQIKELIKKNEGLEKKLEAYRQNCEKDLDGLGSKVNNINIVLARLEEKIMLCTENKDKIFSNINSLKEEQAAIKSELRFMRKEKK